MKPHLKSKEHWYLYILLCDNGSYYTGITKDLQRRFNQHKLGKGAKYTKRNPPKKLVYFENHSDHRAAARKEVEIKKLSHLQKKALIKNNN